jgi:hypothetical protein
MVQEDGKDAENEADNSLASTRAEVMTDILSSICLLAMALMALLFLLP